MEKIKIKDISQNAIVVEEHEPVEPPSAYSVAVLMALQGKHVYQGTVAPAEKARRRAANRVARKSRRANR